MLNTLLTFRVVDSHFICVSHPAEKRVLCDMLLDYGFGYIPDFIHYCLADNGRYSLKYRVFGGHVTVFIKPLN